MSRHTPVLLEEVLHSLRLEPGKHIIDCTVGDGGHTEHVLKLTHPGGKVLGIDLDPESLLRAKKYLYEYHDRMTFVRDNFDEIKKIVQREEFGPVHGILFDFGWSAPQFEERKRGFSFKNRDEKLDMRYDTAMKCAHESSVPVAIDGKEIYGRCTAGELVNTKSEKELADIFKKYGEEKLSKEVARALVQKREEYEIETVGDLVDVVLDVYRKKLKTKKDVPWIGGLHPATKVFQALRISINDELGVIERALPQAIDVLQPGGRIVVISFHSLEDRIVKHFFKSQKEKTLKIITKKPIVAGTVEVKKNPHARSAKLRVAERI